jgi:hypothetical protein
MTSAGQSLPEPWTAPSSSDRSRRDATAFPHDGRPPLGAAAPATGRVVGRERELALADGFLVSAAQRFGVLVVEGEAGIGKTTVWREIARRAEGRGFRVLAARPAQAETKLALSAIADLLEPVPLEVFAALPEPQRRALDVALLRVAPAGAALDPLRSRPPCARWWRP